MAEGARLTPSGLRFADDLMMGKNWYTNESVRSLSFFYLYLQEDLKKNKKT